jgi:hypothetical protein
MLKLLPGAASGRNAKPTLGNTLIGCHNPLGIYALQKPLIPIKIPKKLSPGRLQISIALSAFRQGVKYLMTCGKPAYLNPWKPRAFKLLRVLCLTWSTFFCQLFFFGKRMKSVQTAEIRKNARFRVYFLKVKV